MKDLYKRISNLAENTGYSVDFLFSMYQECGGDWDYFEGVSYEHDW